MFLYNLNKKPFVKLRFNWVCFTVRSPHPNLERLSFQQIPWNPSHRQITLWPLHRTLFQTIPEYSIAAPQVIVPKIFHRTLFPKYSIEHCSKIFHRPLFQNILVKPLNLKSQGLANLAPKTKFIHTRYNHKRKKTKTQSNRKVLIARRYLQRKNSEICDLGRVAKCQIFYTEQIFQIFQPQFYRRNSGPFTGVTRPQRFWNRLLEFIWTR